MAPAVSIKRRNAVGDQFERLVELTLDATYPSPGGWPLTPQQLGFGANGVIDSVQVAENRDGFNFSWNTVTQKLVARRTGAINVAEEEAPNNLAALNTLVIRLLVRGRGSPG
jgi:hypothetical protein